MSTILIKDAEIINEGKRFHADVYIKDGIIQHIGNNIQLVAHQVIHAEGLLLLPGCIDDQVHFREPGLTHKGNIYSEAKAAVAGGVTTYMEMPNTVPNATTIPLLEDKYNIAQKNSLANYSFFLGSSNDNVEEVMKADPKRICGIKMFMGSSTGNMLVDNPDTIEKVFANTPMLIATHCENDPMIKANQQAIVAKYGEDIDATYHGIIRNEEACYTSSSMAVEIAKKHKTRLHILHISTAKELSLFRNDIPLELKRITAEACIHHLWFSEEDYKTKGNFIKWNPAVKKASDRDEIFKAVLDGRIDVIATDHAPHTLEEKNKRYLDAPSGGPLVQHSLLAMLDFVSKGKISIEKVVEKMAHNPAILFDIDRRGYIREGYYADLVLVNPKQSTTVTKESLLYHCGWSPFEGHTFTHQIHSTLVNGHIVYQQGQFDESKRGMRLEFLR
jgi:dihydroorotase